MMSPYFRLSKEYLIACASLFLVACHSKEDISSHTNKADRAVPALANTLQRNRSSSNPTAPQLRLQPIQSSARVADADSVSQDLRGFRSRMENRESPFDKPPHRWSDSDWQKIADMLRTPSEGLKSLFLESINPCDYYPRENQPYLRSLASNLVSLAQSTSDMVFGNRLLLEAACAAQMASSYGYAYACATGLIHRVDASEPCNRKVLLGAHSMAVATSAQMKDYDQAEAILAGWRAASPHADAEELFEMSLAEVKMHLAVASEEEQLGPGQLDRAEESLNRMLRELELTDHQRSFLENWVTAIGKERHELGQR